MTDRRSPRRRSVALLAGLASLLAGTASALADRPVAGAIGPDRLKLPSGPNSVRGLAGEPAVDPFYAQVNYRVPIELPAGLGGLAPNLALTYVGTLGNGPLGIGWSLSHTRIQRATRLGVPKYLADDELEISGVASGRLVPISATEYRVEGMGQTVRVTRAGDGFEIEDGNGLHYRLGETPAGRQDSGSRTFAWLCEDVTNPMGERVRYEYQRDQGQLYLTAILWGPRDLYRVDLAYGARPDVVKSYREGFSVVTARRLDTITVTAEATVRRAYQMVYTPPAGVTGFSLTRLYGVTSTGRAGRGSWPALSFTYAPAAPATSPEAISGAGTWRLNGNGITLVDIDGDGASDLLQLSASGHGWRQNRDGVFQAPTSIAGNNQSITDLQLQDIDGDARPELLGQNATGWLVWKFVRNQWIQQSAPWPGSQAIPLKDPTMARFADLNGDGLVDAIRWNSGGLLVSWASRTGLGAVQPLSRIDGSELPSTNDRFYDANGDGLDDYIVIRTDHLNLFLGHGDGTFDPLRSIAYPTAEPWAPDSVELADLDRDGLMDLVRIDSGTVRWFRGLAGGGFSSSPVQITSPEPLSPATVVTIADSNGNGSQDLVWSTVSNLWRLDLAGTTTAGMLVGVQNGLGMDVTFQYRSSHALSAAARTAGLAWASEVPISMPVPVHKATALGPGEVTRHVDYKVADGMWDAVEQRFGGFLLTTVTTSGATPAETGSVITRHLAGLGTSRALRGKPSSEQVVDGTGRRLSLTTYDWTTMAVADLPDVPLLRAAILTHKHVRYEDTNPVRETDVTYGYDTLGRSTHEVDSGRIDVTGDESVKDTTYADDATPWIRNRVCEEKISSLTGTVASHVQHLFGDDQTVQALCVVGKGWPRETRAWLADSSRWVTQEQIRYDRRGNPTAVIQRGVERRLQYDPDGLFVTEEHLTAPGGDELVWSATWDRVLGVIETVADPNGHTVTMRHDDLGRLTTTAIEGRAPHQEIAYDWTAPFPRTTVWAFDGALSDVTARPTTWSATGRWRQTVEVSNGLGEVRYRAVRLADDRWIVSNYHEVDPNGRVVFAGRPVIADQLELRARPTDVVTHQVIVGDQLRYDPLGRLIEQTLPTGARRTYAYFAFERTMQDADLAPVHSVIDGQGRAILTERSLPDGTHEIVQATYDPMGRLTQMTLSGGTITRSFQYDTLGRLVQSFDPDLGARTLTWDDGDRLTSETNAAGQTVRYGYDLLGRLATRDTGAVFTYHYDTARPGAPGPLTNLRGQLAYIDEPTGNLDLGYDELGRATFTRRTIDAQSSESTSGFAASGLLLGRSFDDGFAITYAYDPAGRVIRAGDLWSIVGDQTASGKPRHERTQNGVDTTYDYDVLDLTRQVTVKDATGAPIYDVLATRNAATEITAIADLDHVGLDHSATFSYDGFAHLTDASIGSGADTYTFGYRYDALHNMTSRTAAGPRSLGVFAGTYRYAEAGRAPRQLTSIADSAGVVTHRFDYDAAGRQTSQDQQTMTYDASDRLLRVDGVPGGSVAHAYGHDGARLKTTAPDGSASYFFGDGTALRHGVREHDVEVGSRVVARVGVAVAPTGAASFGAILGVVVNLGARALGLALLAIALVFGSRWARRRVLAAATVGLTLAASCASPGAGSVRNQLSAVATTTFLHTGFAAGPTVFTDSTGRVLEERRYEPFGVPIDATNHTATGDVIGAPDVVARDLNELNKRTEAATGWSDHGARWMAPETGRWLTTDPPVAAPDQQFLFTPWALHPYQYANQNPVIYWDPDGRNPGAVTLTPQAGVVVETATAAGAEATIGESLGGAFLGIAGGALTVGILSMSSDQATPSQAQITARAEAAAQTAVRDRVRQAEQEYGPRQRVNLDTGAIIAASQLQDLTLYVATNLYLANKELVATTSALGELFSKNFDNAGPKEKILTLFLVSRVTMIPDNPSTRVLALPTSKKIGEIDKQIFGTGDQEGIQTVTGDKNFVSAAAHHGVILTPPPMVLPPPQYAGK